MKISFLEVFFELRTLFCAKFGSQVLVAIVDLPPWKGVMGIVALGARWKRQRKSEIYNGSSE